MSIIRTLKPLKIQKDQNPNSLWPNNAKKRIISNGLLTGLGKLKTENSKTNASQKKMTTKSKELSLMDLLP
jgi:hypothetical protein